MNPLGNFTEDNKDYLDRLFNGNIQTVLVVCHECNNAHMVERGPTIEFNSSFCPFCTAKRDSTTSIDLSDPEKNGKAVADRLKADNNIELANKIQRILIDGKNQKFNVAACTKCNNRYIFLEEDFDSVACCAFCGKNCVNMSALLEYNNGEANSVEEEAPKHGLEKYIGQLFYIKLRNGVDDNFQLTDVDQSMLRYRFVSVNDDRMALWITDKDIIELFEFVHNNPPPDPPADDE